jgi:hypothetical protein
MARPELCDHHSNLGVTRKPNPKRCGYLRGKSNEVSVALHNEHWFVCRGDPSHVPMELPASDQELGWQKAVHHEGRVRYQVDGDRDSGAAQPFHARGVADSDIRPALKSSTQAHGFFRRRFERQTDAVPDDRAYPFEFGTESVDEPVTRTARENLFASHAVNCAQQLVSGVDDLASTDEKTIELLGKLGASHRFASTKFLRGMATVEMREEFPSPRTVRANLDVGKPFPELSFGDQWEQLVAEILDVEGSQNSD